MAEKKLPVKRKPPVKRKNTAKTKKTKIPSAVKVGAAFVLLILLSPLYYGYVLKSFTSTWRWIRDIGQDPNYRTYDDFSVPIPGKYTVHGVDVSYYQGKINWEKVRQMQGDDVRIKFAFIKATEGLLTVDPYFQRNWREAPKAGIVCGAYHFLRPQKSGKWQAVFFLQNVNFEKGDLPPVVDVEELNDVSPAKMRTELLAFIQYVEKKTTVKPIIYTNLMFYKDYLEGYFDDYKLWLAHYYQPKLRVGNKTNWQFWQHTDKATVEGINHVVDMNIFKGDSLAFEKMLID